MLLLSMPTAALIPLILLTMGFGFVAESLIVFLFAVPIIAINTHTGVLNIEASLIQMSRCFLASRSQLFLKVILPGSVPMMMAGLRLGLSRAFIGMITAELILSPLGLGRLISISTSKFQYERLFAVTLSILIAAALILDGMQRIERRLLRWRH
jgi:NitT/TauT family transport system permease protein